MKHIAVSAGLAQNKHEYTIQWLHNERLFYLLLPMPWLSMVHKPTQVDSLLFSFHEVVLPSTPSVSLFTGSQFDVREVTASQKRFWADPHKDKNAALLPFVSLCLCCHLQL